jgi:hypothetical protein
MSRTILSEYSALISDTIAYLKELPSPLLVSKEEWQVPVHPRAKTAAPAPFHKEVILPKTSMPKTEPKMEPKTEPKTELRAEKKETPHLPQQAPQHRPKPEQGPIKLFLQNVGVRLSDKIPDDAAATRMMLSYKEHVGTVDVILFACDTDPHTLELVKNLSRSIDQKLRPIKVLRPDRWEREERWDVFFSKNPVKLFIATAGFTQLKKGMAHYKRVGDATFLHDTPLILLLPSEAYAPQEKILLWNQLCAALKT